MNSVTSTVQGLLIVLVCFNSSLAWAQAESAAPAPVAAPALVSLTAGESLTTPQPGQLRIERDLYRSWRGVRSCGDTRRVKSELRAEYVAFRRSVLDKYRRL